MTGKRIGYIRVSSLDQNPDRQLEGIELDKKFIDYCSTNNTTRPQLQALIDYIREDDTIYVHSMDRLARRVLELKKYVNVFVSKKVKVIFVKENLTFTDENNALANLMLHMMAAFSEFEHAYIKERQMEGVAIAKKQGKYKGRKKIAESKIIALREQIASTKTKSQIAKDLGISRITLYKYMNEGKKQMAVIT